MPPYDDSIMNDFSSDPATSQVFSSSEIQPHAQHEEKAIPQLNFDGLLQECGDKANAKLPFVWKVYEMLEGVEKSGDEHLVSWVENGRAFRVHYLDGFLEKVIPQYFNQTKYKSFQRQLNFYGFTRINSGPSCGAYFHPQFIKGDKTRCLSIRPRSSKNRKSKSSKPTANDLAHKDRRWISEIDNIAARSNIEQPIQQQQQQELPLPDPLVAQGNLGLAFQRPFLPLEQQQQQQQVQPQQSPDPAAFSVSHNNNSNNTESPQDGDAVTIFGGKSFHFVE